MIEIACPICFKTRKAPDDAIGRTVQCTCGHKFVLGEAEPPELPELPVTLLPAMTLTKAKPPAKAPRSAFPTGAMSWMVLAAAIVGVVIIAAGSSAATSVALRERKPAVDRSAAIEDALGLEETRTAALTTRLAILEKKLDEQTRINAELAAQIKAKSAAPAVTDTVTDQLAKISALQKSVVKEVHDLKERRRIALYLQFRRLEDKDRNTFETSIQALEKDVITWDQLERLSDTMGGITAMCLNVKSIDWVRNNAIRIFTEAHDKNMVDLIRGDL
jgi:hypothetical protein